MVLKIITILLFSLSVKSHVLGQQYFVYDAATYGTNALVIPAGKVAEFVTMIYGSQPVKIAENNYGLYENKDGRAFVVGPKTLMPPELGTYYYVFKLLDNTGNQNSVPSNAVVIPSDATGSVQIILESSTDLINWTQANPGTYGASTTKRFFRIRAVNQ